MLTSEQLMEKSDCFCSKSAFDNLHHLETVFFMLSQQLQYAVLFVWQTAALVVKIKKINKKLQKKCSSLSVHWRLAAKVE